MIRWYQYVLGELGTICSGPAPFSVRPGEPQVETGVRREYVDPKFPSNTLAVYHALYAKNINYTAVSRDLQRPLALCPWHPGLSIQAMLFPTKTLQESPPFPRMIFGYEVHATCSQNEETGHKCRHPMDGSHSIWAYVPLAHYHSLHATHVTLFGRNFEVSVDNPRVLVSNGSFDCKKHSTYVTARRVPVPEPRAPRRSLATERAPMQAPPNAAAVGMMRFSSLYMLWSR